MNLRQSPTVRLLVGLAITLSAVALSSGYTISQIRTLRRLQAETIDRNRTDSLLLLRIGNNLNSVALSLRDMLDANDPYPLVAWRGQFARIRSDLQDAMIREERLAPGGSTGDQRRFLASSVAQFWDALDRVFALAASGQETEARARIRLSLQSRQAALSAAVSRLLVANNENEQRAAEQTSAIYGKVERNVYLFAAAMLVFIALTGLYMAQANRRMFAQVAALSQRRGELAQELISLQENTFRSISRELHDEFGQILTAIGAMLQRADKRAVHLDAELRIDLREVRETVQETLDRVRSLSQALHPVILDEIGFESAINAYLPGFSKRTGIAVDFEKSGESGDIGRDAAVQLYRVLQEALNNVARHSGSTQAYVRLQVLDGGVTLEVEDEGVGFSKRQEAGGIGLISMRERAALVNGRIALSRGPRGGALVRFTVPAAAPETAHA